MMRFLRNLLRRRPVIIPTYQVKRTDLQKLKDKKNAQLARELGRQWGAR